MGPALLALALAAATGAADLERVAWMAGEWVGSAGGVEMEEVWMAPRAGSMLGLHRDTAGGRTVSFEYLRLEATPEGITYWASPGGRPATPFKLVESGGARAVFENATHDFPRRIVYWRCAGGGALCARTEGTRAGKPFAEQWQWRRAPDPPRAH
jgi:hypothetical protein